MQQIDTPIKKFKKQLRNAKIAISFSSLLIGGTLLGVYFQEKSIDSHLKACSRYTIAHLTRVSYRSGTPWLFYRYQIDGVSHKSSKQIKAAYTGDWWYPDVKQVQQRAHFIVQVDCQQPKIHKLRWDLLVPTSIQNVPQKGWKQLPVAVKIKS